jgi:hypothetical protein
MNEQAAALLNAVSRSTIGELAPVREAAVQAPVRFVPAVATAQPQSRLQPKPQAQPAHRRRDAGPAAAGRRVEGVLKPAP